MGHFSLILYLTLSSILTSFSPLALADGTITINYVVPIGMIKRARKQQILATIPPNQPQNIAPFLTSPSGKYTACLLRRGSLSGGYGNDFCYVQVQETATSQSMWESKCMPVSNANSCTLLFSKEGLEIFDGSNSVWDTNADKAEYNFLTTIELVDEGDMRIHDKDGKLAWKASDLRRVNQHCGLKPARPPFSQPIGDKSNFPRAANVGLGRQGGQMRGVSQSFGFSDMPLVDNNPYDSNGSYKEKCNWAGVFIGFILII